MHIEICTDCHLAHHGYDENEIGYAPAIEPLHLVRDSLTMWQGDDEPFFSWKTCDGCGDKLGGDRFTYQCEFV